MLIFDKNKFVELRKKINFTQQGMAREICVGVRTIQNWEKGDFEPSTLYMKKIVEFFNKNGIEVKIEDMFCEDENEVKESKRKKEFYVDGNMIKKYRKELGLLQKELAVKVGVFDFTVSKWEREKLGCSKENLAKLADIFGCTEEDLCKKEECTEREREQDD